MTRDSSIVKCPTCDGPITLTETMRHVYKATAEHKPGCGFLRINNTWSNRER